MPTIARESGVVKSMHARGFGFIASEVGDDVFFLRGDIRGVPEGVLPRDYRPPLGQHVTFIRARVTAAKYDGRKKNDKAIDIEVV